MARTTLELTEMHDADVKFISLVKRGANKIPFRIIKSEDGKMIDLGKLFMSKKQEAPTPAIVGFAVAKSDKTDGYVQALKDAGYEFTQDEVSEGVVLTVKESDPDKITTIKVSDDLAIMVSDVTKGFYGYSDSCDFGTKMATDGFYSSLYTAMNVLGETVCNLMYKADGAAPLQDIAKAFDDAKSYVESLVNNIPAECFKLEKLEPVVKAIPPADDEEEEGEGGSCPECGAKMKTGKECKACGGKGKAKKDDEPAEETPVVKEEGSEESASTETTEGVSTESTEAADVVKTVTDLLEKFSTSITAKLETEITAIKASVEEATAIAKKSEETLSSTILGVGVHPDMTQKAVEKNPAVAVFNDVLKFDGFEGR